MSQVASGPWAATPLISSLLFPVIYLFPEVKGRSTFAIALNCPQMLLSVGTPSQLVALQGKKKSYKKRTFPTSRFY